MRRNLYISVLLVILLGIISCKDSYYIENDLHGIWQVTSIEHFSTDEIIAPQGTLYYLFQRTMVSLCYNYLNVPEKLSNVIAHFDLIAPDSIGMGEFRVSTTGEGNNINKETKIPLSDLHKFGLYQNYTTFHMQQSKQKLILTSDSACIVLRRY